MLRLLKRAAQLAIAAAVVGVAVQELQKPAEERTWQGRLWGWIPYDLRLPWVNTSERLRAAYWNPEDPHLLTSRVFGIGWGVNLPVLARRLQEWNEGLRRFLTLG